MTVEEHIPTLWQWLLPGGTLWQVFTLQAEAGALLTFLVAALVLAVLGLFAAFLLCAMERGPAAAVGMVSSGISRGVAEISEFSLRRTWAMTYLAFQEAVRRRVLVAFAVFVVVKLFASWYLDVETDSPAVLYMGAVLGLTNLLVLLLALFLSTFSLPNDIKNRTIYTVVTKPVRYWELILGRMFGFTLIGTLILLVMGVLSYVFVVRGLSHSHAVDVESLREDPSNVDEDGNRGLIGETSRDDYHRHVVYINPDGSGFTDVQKGHRHRITREGEGADARYVVGPPVGNLRARVPIYGNLSFLDRAGKPTDKGVNVGNEWTYRSYIEGGTLAAVIWTFDGITPRKFPQSQYGKGIPLEMMIRVFRTHKGDIERGILGSLEIVQYLPPDQRGQQEPLVSEPINFYAQEFTADRKYLPRKLKARRGGAGLQDVDLFSDMIQDGKLQVRVRCLENAQYYGAAKADVYVWAGDNPFWWNFAKGYAGIWFQMVLVIAFGVVLSTFLNAQIAMLGTLMIFVLGLFRRFVTGVATGELEGGGPFESLIRMVEQRNLVTELDESVGTSIIMVLDSVVMFFVQAASFFMPDFGWFQISNYVAHGYDIRFDLLAEQFLTTLAFFVVLTVIGYFVFRSREIAA